MALRIGDRVRTPGGDTGVVQSIQDPQQIHVLFMQDAGESVTPVIRAYGPDELTLVAGVPVPEAVEVVESDADDEDPGRGGRRGRRHRSPEAP